MKTRFAICCSLTLLGGLLIAQPSSAFTRSIYAKWSGKPENLCRPANDKLSYDLLFSAKIKVKNAPKPKLVAVYYAITDVNGAFLEEGDLKLTAKNGFKRPTGTFTANAGETLTYKANVSFKSPLTGKTIKSTQTKSFPIPSADEMTLANAQNPTAQPYPDCV